MEPVHERPQVIRGIARYSSRAWWKIGLFTFGVVAIATGVLAIVNPSVFE
jgi:hypothetical protein